MSQALAPRVLTKRQQEVLTQVENGINPYFTARAYGSSFHQMMWRIRDLMAWRKKQWVLPREGRAVLKQARR
mgnify:FL=1